MNRLTLFHTVAYEALLHDSGSCHYMNDTEFFKEFYSLVSRKDADAVDVGFNVGMQAELMLQFTTGKVFGFEASTKIYEHALEKFGDNSRVRLFNVAVSNTAGTAQFYDTELWGAGSLKQTLGMKMSQAEDHRIIPVDLARLDDLLAGECNIGLMKLDIEGAEILALDGARALLERNRPYMVMEYCHNALAFEYRGKMIDQMTLHGFAKEIGYKVYNIFGICLSDPEVWQASILRDTADVFLIPEEEHERWVNELLPKYQYRIYDKISEAIERNSKSQNFFALVGMPSRIYEFLNTSSLDQSLTYLTVMGNQLRESTRDRKEIFGTNKLSRRGEILLALLFDQKIQEAYDLGVIKNLMPNELEHFETLIAS